MRPNPPTPRRVTSATHMLLRAVIVMSVALAGVGAGATVASASCAPPEDERTRLERADAAFVGEFVRRGSDNDNILFFDVERGVKGEFGNEVAVRDAYPHSSVSMQPTPGKRVGLLLTGAGSEYTANACQFADPDALIRAAGMDDEPPAIQIEGSSTHSLARSARIRLLASLSERSDVAVAARLLVNGRRLRGSVDVEPNASTGGRPRPVRVSVVVGEHARRAVRQALQRGGSAELVLRVVARDTAGNRGVARRAIQLVR